MRQRFVELLACPDCQADLALVAVEERAGDAVVEGELQCAGCERRFSIRQRIPRFVDPDQDYAGSFGWQWKRFHHLQRDSYNGTSITRDRVLSRTGWGPDVWQGKRVLECGSGSGNDTEVLAGMAGTLVSMDLSVAVEAMPPEILARPNVLVLQADLRRAPLKSGSFDIVYCHRVIQHTPDPAVSFRAMTRYVRPGGNIFLHTYDTDWRSRLHYRYWLRPLLRPLSHQAIFRLMRVVGPVLYPVAGFFQYFSPLRRLGSMFVPFTNHNRRLRRAGSTLSARERYDYSLVLTFDELTPRYDNPSSPATVERWFAEAGFEQVAIRKRRPIVATAVRPAAAEERAVQARTAAAE